MTLLLLTGLCVVGVIIGMQPLVTLGVTANTSIVGALFAMALARMPLRTFARYRSIDVPLLAGAALAMLVDATMLYRLCGSRAFPTDAAWPPGFEGGRRVLLLGGGVIAGVAGTGFLGIPMSAFGVAFLGNVRAHFCNC